MYCKNCGAELAEGQALCTDCQAMVGDGNSFCDHCGKPIQPEQAICLSCGFMISKKHSKALSEEKEESQHTALDFKAKKIHILEMAVQALCILGILALVFLPIFQAKSIVKFESFEDLEDFEGFEDVEDLEDFWEKGEIEIKKSFSFFGDLVKIIGAFFNDDVGGSVVVAFVFRALGIVALIYAVILLLPMVKKLYASAQMFGIPRAITEKRMELITEKINQKDTIDVLKAQVEEGQISGRDALKMLMKQPDQKKSRTRMYAILFAISDIAMSLIFGSILKASQKEGDLSFEPFYCNMMNLCGITAVIVVPILLFVGAFVCRRLAIKEEDDIIFSMSEEKYTENADT